MARTPVFGNKRILPQGALLEFIPQGAYVKVSAVDPVTFVEVSIIGDPAAGEAFLTRTAVQKLERMVFKYKYGKGQRQRRENHAVPRGCRPEPPSGWEL